jgi:hypothetical protein
MARGTTVSCKLAGNADGLDRLAEYFGGVGALLVSSTLSVAQHGQTRHWQPVAGPASTHTYTYHPLLETPSHTRFAAVRAPEQSCDHLGPAEPRASCERHDQKSPIPLLFDHLGHSPARQHG